MTTATNKYLGEATYIIKTASDVLGKGYGVLNENDNRHLLGKYYKTLKGAENYCKKKGEMFRLKVNIKYN